MTEKKPNKNHADMFDRGRKDAQPQVDGHDLAPQSDNKFYLQGYLYGKFKKGFRVTPGTKP